MTKRSRIVGSCVFLLAIPVFALENHQQRNSGLREPEELYQRAQYAASLSLLDRHSKDPAALFLIGRDYYMLGDFPKAIHHLKIAVVAAPENDEWVDWLGRSYARRAETSDPLSAVVLGKKAKQAFERAVVLNPKNADALSDLFDYYLHAPAILGGGHGKAETVAEKMSAVDPSQAFLEDWKLSKSERNGYSHAQPDSRRKLARRHHNAPRDSEEGE
jgi:tetratricopeptide (TPR) repeat protein